MSTEEIALKVENYTWILNNLEHGTPYGTMLYRHQIKWYKDAIAKLKLKQQENQTYVPHRRE